MIRRVIVFTVCAMLAFACTGCERSYTPHEGLHIITTIFPAYDAARSIAGLNAEVSLLLPPGSEVHSFEPTPQDIIDIQNCDLFIYNGGESDAWVDKLLSSDEYASLHTLRMMDCVDVLDEEAVNETESHDHYHEENNDHRDEHDHDVEHEHNGEADEHIWTSPLNVIKISEAIADALCEIDKTCAESYMSNLDMHKNMLLELDGEFRKLTESIDNRTMIFADRFPMRYFAEEYGFECYAAFPGCSSETEPSISTIVFLIDMVREKDINAVFCMEFSDGRMADTICDETDAKKYYLHSCHTVSANDFNKGITYETIMLQNFETLKLAFNG